MRVFVISMRGKPLMPCSNKKARTLLKSGKAKIVKYNPFTIQLTQATGETVQPVSIGVDTGAKHIGIAITSEDKVLVKGEIELRDDISENLQYRATRRKERRSRNTRYRKPKFLNRKRKEGWLPPSVQSKLDATFRWIDTFCLLIPNPQLHIEVGKFDISKIINPEIIGMEYQNDNLAGYNNLRAYVFARDKYTCQVCKKRNKVLEAHHVVFRSCGGTDRADNLISVCTDCHTPVNHKHGGILHQWMLKGKKLPTYKGATFMNIVRKRTMARYPNAAFTYGYETQGERKKLNLSKTHYNDAIAISGIQTINQNSIQYFHSKQFRKKKRSLHEAIPRRGRSEKNTTAMRVNKNVKERAGFFLGDKVIYNKQSGWIYGFAGGPQGKECVVRNLNGDLIKTRTRRSSLTICTNNLQLLNHNNNWLW